MYQYDSAGSERGRTAPASQSAGKESPHEAGSKPPSNWGAHSYPRVSARESGGEADVLSWHGHGREVRSRFFFFHFFLYQIAYLISLDVVP
jgi:hypothetical protein